MSAFTPALYAMSIPPIDPSQFVFILVCTALHGVAFLQVSVSEVLYENLSDILTEPLAGSYILHSKHAKLVLRKKPTNDTS